MNTSLIVSIAFLLFACVYSQDCAIEGPYLCSGGLFEGLDFGDDEDDDFFEYFASVGDTETPNSCTVIQQGEYEIDDDNQIFVELDDDSDDDCVIAGDSPELCSCIQESIEFSISEDCLTISGPNGETCIAVDTCEDSFTCPGNQTPIDDPNEEPSPNGCGPSFFPLTGPSLSFRECCVEHDICYGTCGSSKRECDQRFYGCMACSCEAEYDNFFTEAACTELACSYFEAVDEFGCLAFGGSQDRACTCPGQKASPPRPILNKFGSFVPPNTTDTTAVPKLLCTAPFDPNCDNYTPIVSSSASASSISTDSDLTTESFTAATSLSSASSFSVSSASVVSDDEDSASPISSSTSSTSDSSSDSFSFFSSSSSSGSSGSSTLFLSSFACCVVLFVLA